MSTKAVLYLRVSTLDQDASNQRPEVEQLSLARGFTVIEVVDEAVSTRRQRPGWDHVMDLARRGKVNAVVIWSIDRLGRELAGNLNTILELDRLNVEVVSVRQPWLTTRGPTRPLLVAIFSFLAEWERDERGARTRAGLERVRRRGVKLGRPSKSVNVIAARSMKTANGWTWERVAREIGVSRATLLRALAGETR